MRTLLHKATRPLSHLWKHSIISPGKLARFKFLSVSYTLIVCADRVLGAVQRGRGSEVAMRNREIHAWMHVDIGIDTQISVCLSTCIHAHTWEHRASCEWLLILSLGINAWGIKCPQGRGNPTVSCISLSPKEVEEVLDKIMRPNFRFAKKGQTYKTIRKKSMLSINISMISWKEDHYNDKK